MSDISTIDLAPHPTFDESGVALSHIGILVKDLARSARFYSQALGFEVGNVMANHNPQLTNLLKTIGVPYDTQNLFFMRRNGVMLELYSFEGGSPEPAVALGTVSGFTGFAFQTKDVDGLASKIEKAGGTVREDTRTKFGEGPTGYQVLLCTDPDGIKVELIGPQ